LAASSVLGGDDWEVAEAIRIGYCRRPVIVEGRDPLTGSSRRLAMPCRSRRHSECPACA
jgi:hypothetical protein